MSPENNKPLISARSGVVSIAVFDGEFGVNAVVQKSYLKKGGDVKNNDDWNRSQINLFLNEIPKLKEVVDEISEKYANEIEASIKKKE
jgi:hypothetical protein